MISQTYDLDAGALYVQIAEGQVARSAQVDPGTLVDLDSAGAVLGIEVVQPQRVWPLEEILQRFPVSTADSRELRAYFAHPAELAPSEHTAALVPVAVPALARTALAA